VWSQLSGIHHGGLTLTILRPFEIDKRNRYVTRLFQEKNFRFVTVHKVEEVLDNILFIHYTKKVCPGEYTGRKERSRMRHKLITYFGYEKVIWITTIENFL
jgi:hypothetical protein